MMKGLERAEAFYLEAVKPMIESEFKSVADRIAVGLVGHGSECFGYDDELSADHDHDGGVCLWLTNEDDKAFGFKLMRAYDRLAAAHGVYPKEKSALGGGFKGVKTIEGFYSFYVGDGLPQTVAEWLAIPDFYLAEATNGRVFCDKLGEFTKIRDYLIGGRPEDVRLKKLASALFYMAQYGQYNYSRCLRRGEFVAAGIALTEFIKSAMDAAFLLSRRYAPYYKWTFRALKDLDELSFIAKDLDKLIKSPLDAAENAAVIESVCRAVVDFMVGYGYFQKKGDYLEAYAYAVNDLIADGELRNSPVML